MGGLGGSLGKYLMEGQLLHLRLDTDHSDEGSHAPDPIMQVMV